jgi:hypothetical protein
MCAVYTCDAESFVHYVYVETSHSDWMVMRQHPYRLLSGLLIGNNDSLLQVFSLLADRDVIIINSTSV